MDKDDLVEMQHRIAKTGKFTEIRFKKPFKRDGV